MITSNSLPKYRFQIKSKFGTTTLKIPPLEWKQGEYELDRDITKGGVTQQFNADSLSFVKDGADILDTLFYQDGINAEAELIIGWLNIDTQSYVSYPTIYSFTFKKWKKVKRGRLLATNIVVKKSGLLQKIEDRGGVDVDVTKTESVGGFEIVDYSNLKKWLKFPAIYAYLKAELTGGSGYALSTGYNSTIDIDDINSSDFNEIQVITGQQSASKANSFFYESESARTIDITGTIDLSLSSRAISGRVGFKTSIIIYDSSGVEVSTNAIDTTYIQVTNPTATSNISGVITLSSGESACLVGQMISPEDVDDEITWDSSSFNLSEAVIQTPEINVESYPDYECFERILQKITDRQFPLYSTKFGRTDTTYNYNGDVYATEDQLSFGVATSGLAIRGDGITNINNPLALNWEDWFKTKQSQHNIGWGIETIEGEDRVVIKDYSDFFQTNIVKDFSDQLTFLDIESEVTETIIYNELISGNENYDYEAINGRGEYNTENKRTTVLNTSNTFDNKSKYREDTRGITLNLEYNQEGLNTSDEKEDNDIFTIKVQRNNATIHWVAETDENVIIDDNTSLYEEGSLNLLWTPTRKLIRNSTRWTCGFKELSSKARFQTAGKLQTLKTTGEGYTITENDDITINDVSLSLFNPIKHTFEVELDWNDILDIQNNPYAKVRITSSITGWILNLKKKNNESKALITIIEAA